MRALFACECLSLPQSLSVRFPGPGIQLLELLGLQDRRARSSPCVLREIIFIFLPHTGLDGGFIGDNVPVSTLINGTVNCLIDLPFDPPPHAAGPAIQEYHFLISAPAPAPAPWRTRVPWRRASDDVSPGARPRSPNPRRPRRQGPRARNP
ncbi:hypothetical protein M430DRAFT_212621 [Amorphotheca resinae ATCC 22711]|jgi:hypothetical protein|uniref:Uncharacterized protein n=1 Tax=Amorphotheca resinae ATCC 22711 TaxID=857342 RepID=A0A2T3B847_AMORE|nr:hypothetical protein M430DRAFT_212621 [Amorphotheca resinae ATCC 22711]PSS23049.1 hypothetical protein M430DRAFT_212621 [Amorphotheca resinae ATCC 22711]